MKTQILISVLAIMFFSNCEKDNYVNDSNDEFSLIYDTIFPKAYLPAYPGSYWIYNNGDTIKTGNDYILDTVYKCDWEDDYNNNRVIDTCYIILIAYFPIYNNYYLNGYYSGGYGLLLDEKEGTTLFSYCDKMSCGHEWVKKKDTSMVLPNNQKYDSVIVTEYEFELQSSSLEKYEYYYAKNVGHIGSKVIYDWISGIDSIQWRYYLIGYHIEK